MGVRYGLRIGAQCDEGKSEKFRVIWDKGDVTIIQIQPFRDVPKKRCFENMQEIYRRTPMPNCDFNKVARHFY